MVQDPHSRQERLPAISQSDHYDFQCPGEPARISRAVHLARLADGYPACARCQHREDVAGLPERVRKKVPTAQRPKRLGDFVYPHGLQGSLHEGFDPRFAGRFAAGFGLTLRDSPDMRERYPTIAVASDGRPATQRHFAGAVEQLRWVGCNVLELGPVPCPALSWAIGELDLDGGLYLGNPTGQAQGAGIRFVGRNAEPIVGPETLQAICRLAASEPDRPVRTSGDARRADAISLYESRFVDSFHGLRPLRFLFHTTCPPAGTCLARLLEDTACKMVLRESDSAIPEMPLSETVGHFAAAIDDDGRRCRVWDERGTPVPFETLFLLLVRQVCQDTLSDQPLVVEDGLPRTLASVLEQWGLNIHGCGSLPSDIHAAMVSTGAALGADTTGHIWYGDSEGRAIADGLGVVTDVLGKLSEGDRPLSEVLDAETQGY